MKTHLVLAVAALSLGLTTVQAYAEGEGTGDPFPFRAPARSHSAAAFAADTGSNGYPDLTGRPTQPPSETPMMVAGGSEPPVHSVGSMPRGFEEGTVAYVQARSLESYEASRQTPVRVATAVLADR